jgi:hypothetical protein
MREAIEEISKPDRSPCMTCRRMDMDKTACAPICKRIDAFRRGLDYSDIPIPDEAGIQESGHYQTEHLFCSRCEARLASGDDGLCSWCRRAMKRRASKDKKAA